MPNRIIFKGNTYIKAEETLWEATMDGTIQLGPAQVEDPEGVLKASGGPSIQDIASSTWKRNIGDFQRAMNPWKPLRGSVAELECVFLNKKTGAKWKVILRGQTRTYEVKRSYELPSDVG